MKGIRRASQADRRELLRMLELMLPGEASPEEVASWFASAANGTFVYERGGGRLGGFIHVGERPYAEGALTSPVAFIEQWFVDRDLRRTGLGGRLMRTAERWALSRGHTELASDTWLSNVRSRRAHQRLGFAIAEKLVCFIKPL